MRSSLRAYSRQLVSSPKESGEIGETIGDMIARHPHSAERVKSLVSRIEEYAELMTPGIATAFEREVSAAVSPIQAACTRLMRSFAFERLKPR